MCDGDSISMLGLSLLKAGEFPVRNQTGKQSSGSPCCPYSAFSSLVLFQTAGEMSSSGTKATCGSKMQRTKERGTQGSELPPYGRFTL